MQITQKEKKSQSVCFNACGTGLPAQGLPDRFGFILKVIFDSHFRRDSDFCRAKNLMKKNLTTPCYIVEESLLRRNLALIKKVAEAAGVEFILAFKAYALWRTFPIFREYISHTTASSPYEARLAYEEYGSKAHAYSPAYEESTFSEIVRFSSHITFNSLTQYQRFHAQAIAGGASVGLRVNPEYSEIETAIYDPCAPGSRFGVLADDLPRNLPEEIEGFHVHCHCESSALALVHTLAHLEEKFGQWLPNLKWLNLGGGHLLTREGYDINLFINTMQNLHVRYPNLRIILEPGSAFAWQTGALYAQVVDIVESKGIKTAILNVSFTCHMPDCLEMPYHPSVRGAETLADIPQDIITHGKNVYRLGGNSCLSGDYMGYWRFENNLEAGDIVVFEDMIHYTTVKTNMFNGIQHPALKILRLNGAIETLREFVYEDYRDRMD